MIIESADFAFNMVDHVKDQESFKEAYNHPEVDKKIKWQNEILNKCKEMKAKGVWEKFEKSDIPNGPNNIKDKWIF